MRLEQVVPGHRPATDLTGAVLARDLRVGGERWSKGRRLDAADLDALAAAFAGGGRRRIGDRARHGARRPARGRGIAPARRGGARARARAAWPERKPDRPPGRAAGCAPCAAARDRAARPDRPARGVHGARRVRGRDGPAGRVGEGRAARRPGGHGRPRRRDRACRTAPARVGRPVRADARGRAGQGVAPRRRPGALRAERPGQGRVAGLVDRAVRVPARRDGRGGGGPGGDDDGSGWRGRSTSC